ncbi:MAG: HD domain-containing protein [Coriobacteriales bacterium]|nr:HD domain-containing protein [Coriobacteriales bacterium]
MHIPPHVVRILNRLEAGGFDAYVVGGCVRDALRGVTPHDWDIASAATPAQVAALFADAAGTVSVANTADAANAADAASTVSAAEPGGIADASSATDDAEGTDGAGAVRVLATGERHGTLTLLVPEGSVEVTTFRSDGKYSDGRHPEQVRFLSAIQDDLARRDFTMNAVAFRQKSGFVDPFGGRADIAAGLIRAVGDPSERLREDALRIMRALRFSATLGFRIDDGLAASLHANRALLARIAPERICAELVRMLVGPGVLDVLLAYPDVLAVPIPEITATVGHDQRTPYHCYDIWEHTARAVAAGKPGALVRLALLMHDMGKPESFSIGEDGRGHFYGHDVRGEEIARARLKALRFDNATVEDVARLVRSHQGALRPETVLRWLNRLDERLLRLLIEVKRGDIAAHADDVAAKGLALMDCVEARLDELIEQRACFSLRDLAVSGDDLKPLGFEQGRELGQALEALLDAVIEGRLDNSREELLAAAVVELHT